MVLSSAILGSIALALGVGTLLASETANKPKKFKASPHTAQTAEAADYAIIRALEARIRTLETAGARDMTPAAAPSGNVPDDPASEKREREKIRQRSAKHRQDLDSAIENESMDFNWATTMESQLEDLFATEALQGSQIATSVCKETLCRLEVDHRDVSLQQTFFERLLSSGLGLNHSLFSANTESDGRTVTMLYVGREGHSVTDTK